MLVLDLRANASIFGISWDIAVKALRQCCYCSSTKHVAARLHHCFGFDVFKYCVFTDGVFEMLSKAFASDCIVITDTHALHNMIRTTCKNRCVKVFCIAGLWKASPIAGCAKSCIQIDVWISLLTVLAYKQIILVIGTAPTTALRGLESVVNNSGKVPILITCPVGIVNASAVKTCLRLNRLRLSYCMLRGKLGGLAFAAAVINGVNCNRSNTTN